jgi:hypothetical protein
MLSFADMARDDAADGQQPRCACIGAKNYTPFSMWRTLPALPPGQLFPAWWSWPRPRLAS